MMQTQKSPMAFTLEIMLLLGLLYAGWWYWSTNPTSGAHSTTTAPINSTAGQHPVIGGPSLSASRIDTILSQHGSPAAGTGQIFYDQSIQTGINDSYPLSFFWHESNMGLKGVARFSKSIGNLRCIPTADCVGGYAYFTSWEQGIEAWYSLIKNLYIDTWHLATVETIIPKYAPTADNNDESAYIASVVNTVQSWQ